MTLWLYDQKAAEISHLRAGRAHTDAGTAPMTGEVFVIEADTAAAALEGAQRWLANWSDDDEPNVPDDLMLVERRRPACVALRVL